MADTRVLETVPTSKLEQTDVRALDLTREKRRRVWRQIAQIGWGSLTAGVAVEIGLLLYVVFAADAGALHDRRYVIAAVLAILIALFGGCLHLARGLGRRDRRTGLIAAITAPVAAVVLILAAIGSASGPTASGHLATLSAAGKYYDALCALALGLLILPASLSARRSIRALTAAEPSSEQAITNSLVFPWRRVSDFFFPGGSVPVVGLALYVLTVVAAGALQFWVPLVWWLATWAALAIATVLVGRGFLRRRTRDLHAALQSDHRAPILYLRSFAADHETVWRWYPTTVIEGLAFRRTLAEFVARAAGSFGPVIAIGEPGRTAKTIGLAQSQFGDEEWQERALGLMDRAGLIVMLAGRTAGLKWEVEQLMLTRQLDKTVILLPRKRGPERLEAWYVLCDAFESAGGIRLPEDLEPDAVALLPSYHGEVVVLTIKRARAAARYELAVRAALKLISGDASTATERDARAAAMRRRWPRTVALLASAALASFVLVEVGPTSFDTASTAGAIAAPLGWPPEVQASFINSCTTSSGGNLSGCECVANILSSEVPADQIGSLSATDPLTVSAEETCRQG